MTLGPCCLCEAPQATVLVLLAAHSPLPNKAQIQHSCHQPQTDPLWL